MDKFKRFAQNRPFLFGLSLIFVYALVVMFSYPVHFLFPEDDVGQLYGDAIAEVVTFAVFLLILWRFGWLKASGLTRLGGGQIWLIAAGILIYEVTIELYAFTNGVSLTLASTPLTAANITYYFPASLVEETMYRALVLIAMISAWGATKRGIVKSVVLSSLIFGLVHLINILTHPAGVVLFQAAVVSLPGLFYAAIVLRGRSLWPAVIIHWLTNAAVNVQLIGVDNYQETTTMWISFALLMIPIVALSAFLLWKLPDTYQYHEIKDVDVTGSTQEITAKAAP